MRAGMILNQPYDHRRASEFKRLSLQPLIVKQFLEARAEGRAGISGRVSGNSGNGNGTAEYNIINGLRQVFQCSRCSREYAYMRKIFGRSGNFLYGRGGGTVGTVGTPTTISLLL